MELLFYGFSASYFSRASSISLQFSFLVEAFSDLPLDAKELEHWLQNHLRLYANYESDAHGAFDVTAGVAVAQGGTVQVEAGDYLVWSGHGKMPQAVLGAWQRIWQHFEAHPEIRRRYVSDFEAYTSPTEVKISIGVA